MYLSVFWTPVQVTNIFYHLQSDRRKSFSLPMETKLIEFTDVVSINFVVLKYKQTIKCFNYTKELEDWTDKYNYHSLSTKTAEITLLHFLFLSNTQMLLVVKSTVTYKSLILITYIWTNRICSSSPKLNTRSRNISYYRQY